MNVCQVKSGISGTFEAKSGINGKKMVRKYGINGYFLGDLQNKRYLCNRS
jgi:hypothetical protein